MIIEIALYRRGDPITGISEMMIKWKKETNGSYLSLECGKEGFDLNTEGDIENKLINYIEAISINPFVKDPHRFLVLDGASYTLSIKQDLFSVDIGWHELLPDDWKGVHDLARYLVDISNAENLCDKHNKSRKATGEEVLKYIDSLPFSKASLRQLLSFAITPTSGVTHQMVAAWCARFAQYCRDEYDMDRFEYGHALKIAEEIAEDVDAQWELYLDNTYYENNRAIPDMATVRLPEEWFLEWVKKLDEGD